MNIPPPQSKRPPEGIKDDHTPRIPSECSLGTCLCPDHILLGLVVTPSGRPLPGAHVSLQDWPGPTATSDADGTFQMPGVCASSRANISAHVDGFSAGVAQVKANSSTSAAVTLVLEQLGKALETG